MNGSLPLLQEFYDVFQTDQPSDQLKIGLCVPFPYLMAPLPLGYARGAQDCSPHEKGAYTGDVSASMLKEMGSTYVLIGHSERRNIHHEQTDLLKQKMAQAFKAGLTPILCIGEKEEEKEKGLTLSVLTEQLTPFLDCTDPFIIAYEPIWAIGSGRIAHEDDINSVFTFLHSMTSFPLLYGGSITDTNAAPFINHPFIDGLLVGGASLSPLSWKKLIFIAENARAPKAVELSFEVNI